MTGERLVDRVLQYYSHTELSCTKNLLLPCRGRPPYPLIKDMTEEEVEYLTTWLDYYHAGKSKDGTEGVNEIVGYHKEFKEQQDSGKTTFQLPEKQF